jgi:pilus assembly protein CpaD
MDHIDQAATRGPIGLRRTVAALLFALPLQGCGPDRTVTGTIPDPDYRVNHPIVLAESQNTIDIFPSAGSLSTNQAQRLADFASLYRQNGRGPAVVFYPAGGPSEAASRAALPRIRGTLQANGVRSVAFSAYPEPDGGLAAPVRVSFQGLKARVAGPCGQWPADLASGSSTEGMSNRPFWNFGCSYQNMIAAQVADPRDLVGPRGEHSADTTTRMRGIENVRKGTDPGTNWNVKNTNISTVGGG